MMQTQFYLDLAKQFTQDSDNVTKLALTFQYRDMEKEKFAQIEKEKQQIEMQHQMKLRESSFKKSLSFLSQR